MKQDLKISIVIPIYNQEEYLEKSIESVIRQTYSNIEIIAVNDGSTDKSSEILEVFINKDNRVKIINQRNQGLVAATITGIRHSTGDYICFLDPDDFVGKKYIENFVNELDKEYDFVAAGYYQDNGISIDAIRLKDNKEYNLNELRSRKEYFLSGEDKLSISNEFFISRWNKIYNKKCINKIVDEFEEYKSVSLGEDTIFTFLIISNSENGKTLIEPNEYFYNVYNQKSMMKSSNIDIYINKCNNVYELFSALLVKYDCTVRQAYLLFYFLIDSIFKRLYNNDKLSFKYLYNSLVNNNIYMKSIKIASREKSNIRRRIDIFIRMIAKKPDLYINLINIGDVIKLKCKYVLEDGRYIIKNIFKQNIRNILWQLRFKYDRREAFKDIEYKLPIIENRILPYLNKYKGKKTDLSESTIEKNIFIFWWDGFENAPPIVKDCLSSVYRCYTDYNIIKVSKNNYKYYTDIDINIIRSFEKGKISVQKNNGGMWIDATIFFEKKCDLFEALKKQSFNTLNFYSSSKFLTYKSEECSWSGYFIAARKGSILVEAINYIFERYYLEYQEYTTYFFIDAVFMLCKIYEIDDNVLKKSTYINGDMFILHKLLDHQFNIFEFEKISDIPQKLTWFYKPKNIVGSYYERIVKSKVIDKGVV